jgi:hypothetical protein
MSVCEEENMVELVGENTNLYDGTDSGYSRKDKIDRILENIGND